MKLLNRFRGSMLGLAVGDALGAPIEFSKRGDYEHLTEMIGGGRFRLEPGTWTDDTAMALCLADSLLACGGFDARSQINNYWRWYSDGYRSCTGTAIGVGSTVQQTLILFQAKPSRGSMTGLSGFRAQGNGSLMRLAPVPLFFYADFTQAVFWSGESSRITHSSPICVDACRYMGALICKALQGESKQCLRNVHLLDLCDEIRAISELSFEQISEDQISNTGYVLDTLTAALWSFFTTESFEAGLIKAVNLGEDSDTVGAVYGQLAGAYYGIDLIPDRWLEKLQKRNEIETVAHLLFEQTYKRLQKK